MYAITLDIDWAPDFIIESVADLLEEQGVKSTWFVTHPSQATDGLLHRKGLVERGIHPNFFKNSTQGTSYQEVLDHLKTVVPEAHCVRTHSLYQSNPLLRTMCVQYGMEVDSSLFLRNYENIKPIEFEFAKDNRSLIRLPYIWGDQYEISRRSSDLSFKDRFEFEGIKIFNFHPVHVYFNAYNDSPYQELKRLYPVISKADRQKAEALINTTQRGVKDLLLDLVARIKAEGRSRTLSEVAKLS